VGTRTGVDDMERRKACPYLNLNSMSWPSRHGTNLINLIYKLLNFKLSSFVNIISCVSRWVDLGGIEWGGVV
jgi:hypothetical protein